MKTKASLLLSVASGIALGLASIPAMAIDLNVGGTVNAVTDAVGSITGGGSPSGNGGSTVGGVVGAVTGGVNSPAGSASNGNGGVLTIPNLKVLTPNEVATATARSTLLDGIYAKLDVINKDDLVKVCLDVGGGTGCGSGTQNQLLGLVNTRLGLLSNTGLLNLCLDIGSSGCGASGSGGSGGGGGGGGGGAGKYRCQPLRCRSGGPADQVPRCGAAANTLLRQYPRRLPAANSVGCRPLGLGRAPTSLHRAQIGAEAVLSRGGFGVFRKGLRAISFGKQATVNQGDFTEFISILRLAVTTACARVTLGSSIPMIRINSSSLYSQAARPNRTSCSCGVSRQPPRVFSQKMAAVTHCGPSVVALRNRNSATLAVALMWPVSSSSR